MRGSLNARGMKAVRQRGPAARHVSQGRRKRPVPFPVARGRGRKERDLRELGDQRARTIGAGGADTHEAFERRTDQQDQVARIGTTALIETLLDGLLSEHTKTHRLELVEQVRRLMANPPAGFIGALEAMKHRPDSTDELREIDVPTLVIVGEDDTLSPPDVAREMQQRIRGSELAVLPRAGHLSNLEAADEFNAAVAGFLAGLPGARPS